MPQARKDAPIAMRVFWGRARKELGVVLGGILKRGGDGLTGGGGGRIGLGIWGWGLERGKGTYERIDIVPSFCLGMWQRKLVCWSFEVELKLRR